MEAITSEGRYDEEFLLYLTNIARQQLPGTPLLLKSACDEAGFMFSVELFGKLRCSFRILSCACSQNRLLDSIGKVRDFIIEDYLEARMMTVDSAERFLNLPGKIEFFDDEEKYALIHRVAMISAQERFGRKNVYNAEFISEKTLVFHTREGQFTMRIDDVKNNLKDTLELMSHYMRKPIRKRYDRECNEKKSNRG